VFGWDHLLLLRQEETIAFEGPGEPVWVRGNSQAIEDVIRNLIENALAHAPPQTEVSVVVKRDGSVSVIDRGPGVPADRREAIFERFWRGQGVASVGAGLGLAIVKAIVDAHGGSIQVDTAREGGAVFAVRFPLADEGGSVSQRTADAPAGTTRPDSRQAPAPAEHS